MPCAIPPGLICPPGFPHRPRVSLPFTGDSNPHSGSPSSVSGDLRADLGAPVQPQVGQPAHPLPRKPMPPDLPSACRPYGKAARPSRSSGSCTEPRTPSSGCRAEPRDPRSLAPCHLDPSQSPPVTVGLRPGHGRRRAQLAAHVGLCSFRFLLLGHLLRSLALRRVSVSSCRHQTGRGQGVTRGRGGSASRRRKVRGDV